MNKLFLLLIGSFILIGCNQKDPSTTEDIVIDGNKIAEHIKILSSDEYSADWDMSGMVQDGTLFYQIGDKLANDTSTWPK